MYVVKHTQALLPQGPIYPFQFGNYFAITVVKTKTDSGFDALLLGFQDIEMYKHLPNETIRSFRLYLSDRLEFSADQLNNIHQIVGNATTETKDNELQTILQNHLTGFDQTGAHYHFHHYDLMPYISYLHPNVRFYVYSVQLRKNKNHTSTLEEETLTYKVKTTQIYAYETTFEQVRIHTHNEFKKPGCINKNSKNVFIIYNMNSFHYNGMKIHNGGMELIKKYHREAQRS